MLHGNALCYDTVAERGSNVWVQRLYFNWEVSWPEAYVEAWDEFLPAIELS